MKKRITLHFLLTHLSFLHHHNLCLHPIKLLSTPPKILPAPLSSTSPLRLQPSFSSCTPEISIYASQFISHNSIRPQSLIFSVLTPKVTIHTHVSNLLQYCLSPLKFLLTPISLICPNSFLFSPRNSYSHPLSHLSQFFSVLTSEIRIRTHSHI
ncbi:hypothetical protein L6164_016667 [Bauhinia variegata]|uniref:Uncharacterized protein n=1 Tax=Bauhinia variegata TaxID=167791 RepID=A0ACB9NRQ7_BAUVA|nr:hypothetical protein L6164_016667 [Bauhinia variegata]